jgi:hypothetical protein
MYEDLQPTHNYAPVQNRSLVSPANTALLAITIVVVGLACGLGAYASSLHTLQQLQQQGYQYWMYTTVNSTLVNITDLGGSAWTSYVPGQHLYIAFTLQPLMRGGIACIGIAAGGITLLVASRHVPNPAGKHPGAAFGLVLLLLGLQATFEGPPHGIQLDLPSQHLIAGNTALMLGSITGFSTYTHNTRHNHGTEVDAQLGGNAAELASFGSRDEAQTVQNALQTFTNTGGGQF